MESLKLESSAAEVSNPQTSNPIRLTLFFGLAFALSWGVMIPAFAWLPAETAILSIYLAAFGPFAAAVIVIALSGGRAYLLQWLKTIFNPRIPVWLYLAGAFLLPFLIGFIHYMLYRLWGGWHDFSEAVPWYLYLVYLIPTALISGGNEEPGWRGYALPGLLRYFHPIVASLVLGVLHALWHLPLMDHYQTTFGWYLLNLIPLTFILNWFYLNSSRSIWPVMLLHAGTNVIGSFLTTPGEIFGGLDSFMVLRAVVYWLMAMGILITTRGKMGWRSGGVESQPRVSHR